MSKTTIRRRRYAGCFPNAVLDAGSTRSSKAYGHIELGHFWFFPEGLPSLPHIVEHELAQLQRNDSRTYVIAAAASNAFTVACAGLLPLPYAAAAITALLLACPALSWWSELACDTIAARQCGRTAAVTALTHLLDEVRALPPLARLLHTGTMLRSHPPFRLRRWWVRKAPAVPISPCPPEPPAA
ncbi:hypothetical protein [Streptomyces sp. NPDC093589]|uniref:hypothetical protein n=1 Tax=Streptomyces sp. NPDC093589 TaxID=3366043 RepID=UPI00380F160F